MHTSRLTGLTLIAALAMLAGSAGPATGQAPPAEVALAMEKDKFVPAELKVPANKAFVLVLTNKDDISHEIDIPKLKIEKKVRPGQTIKMPIPALKAGKYEMADDDSTPNLKGAIVAQ
jgi:heme/copper-type cytochrome/quinol oxidase subunit 2